MLMTLTNCFINHKNIEFSDVETLNMTNYTEPTNQRTSHLYLKCWDNFLGLVFMNGLRLCQVLGLTVGSELRLLSQPSFVLNLYSQKLLS